MLRIAQMTIFNAYFKRDKNAYLNAEQQLLTAWAGQYELMERYAPHLLPILKTSTIPLPAQRQETVNEVDGRDGRQWTASIQAYLSWRAGDCWRPMRDRWHLERTYYLDAIRLLNELHSGDSYVLEKYRPAPALPLSPELPHKKPAAAAPHQIPLPLPGLAIQQQLPIWRI